MRKLKAAFLAVLAAGLPIAVFGSPLTDTTTDINTNLPTNNVGSITASALRTVLINFANRVLGPATDSGVSSLKTAAYTIVAADCGTSIVASSGFYTITLPSAASVGADCVIKLKNSDAARGKNLSGFPSDMDAILYPGQATTIKIVNGAWVSLDKPNRWKVRAATTFYVNPSTGSNANDGLATGSGAFQTLQKAWDTLVAQVDTNNQFVKIQAEDGTYTVGLKAGAQPVGGGSIVVSCNVTTPTNCPIAPTVANSVAFQAAGPVFYSVEGFYLNSANILTGLYVDYNGGTIQVTGSMNFGAVSGYHMQSSHGFIFVNSSYTISGGSASGGHMFSAYGGQIEYGGGVTATVTGTPAFFNFARASSLGTIAATGSTFTGAATGARYVAVFNGMIETAGGGANFFPGNAAGLVSNGGIYD